MESYNSDPQSPETTCRSLERWSTWTQHEIDSDKAVVDTVNALIAVAAFIAGVQAAIISLSISLPQTHVGRATNAIAFVGLLLDVMGTFLGVIHAIVLQRRMRGNTTLLTAINQVITNLKVIQDFRNSGASPEKSPQDLLREIGIDDLDLQLRRAQQLCQVLENRFHSQNVSGPFGLAQSVLQSVLLANSAIGISKMRVEALLGSVFGLGRTPLVAMAFGVIALVVSIVLFAAESTALSSEVWVSCVAVLSGVIGLSLLPVTYEKAKSALSPANTERLP